MDTKHIPNILSFFRIALTPVFFFFFISDDLFLQQTALFLFILASLTDSADGYIARKYRSVSALGKFIDPFADKLLTAAAFIGFVMMKIVPLWMVIIIMLRDFGTTVMRIIWNNEFKTSLSAKIKTTLQMIFISVILGLIFIRDLRISNSIYNSLNSFIYSDIIYFTMLVLTIITVWTLIEYIFAIRKDKALSKKYINENKI
jgi:CDP-diacylglycerol--glycerol-3-phosphate 3-phosphatidyltransferase